MNKIKLNHPCDICKEVIYIGEGTIIEKRPLHFKCYKEQIEKEMLDEFEKVVDETILKHKKQDKCGVPCNICIWLFYLKEELKPKEGASNE